MLYQVSRVVDLLRLDKDQYDNTIMSYCLTNRGVHMLKHVFALGFDPNTPTHEPFADKLTYPLLYHYVNKNLDLITLCFRYGANANVVAEDDGRTVLHLTLEKDWGDMCQRAEACVKGGSDVFLTDARGTNPLDRLLRERGISRCMYGQILREQEWWGREMTPTRTICRTVRYLSRVQDSRRFRVVLLMRRRGHEGWINLCEDVLRRVYSFLQPCSSSQTRRR